MNEPVCGPTVCGQCGQNPVRPPKRLCWNCFTGKPIPAAHQPTPTPVVIVNPVRTVPALMPEPPGGWTFLRPEQPEHAFDPCARCGMSPVRFRGLCDVCIAHDRCGRGDFRGNLRERQGNHPLDFIVAEIEHGLMMLAAEPLPGVG